MSITELSGIVVAVVSLVGTVLTATFQVYAEQFRDKRAQIASHKVIIAKYRDPILLASNDLQARLYFLFHDNLTSYMDTSTSHRDYIIYYTLFVFGQYFAWNQIMRYEIQFLDFETSSFSTELTGIASSVTTALSDDSPRPLRIYAGHQRAMGEVMIDIDHQGQRYCIGYAEFRKKLSSDDEFKRWFTQPIADLELIARSPPGTNDQRLRKVQTLLLDYVHLLDPKGNRKTTVHERLKKNDFSNVKIRPDQKATIKQVARGMV